MQSPRRLQGAAGRALRAWPAAVLALALWAPGAPAQQAAVHEVEVIDARFQPAELRIRAGDTVTWVNRERRTSHSIVFDQSGAESERFFPGESWSYRFDTVGEHPYHCGPHPEMRGRIVVD